MPPIRMRISARHVTRTFPDTPHAKMAVFTHPGTYTPHLLGLGSGQRCLVIHRQSTEQSTGLPRTWPIATSHTHNNTPRPIEGRPRACMSITSVLQETTLTVAQCICHPSGTQTAVMAYSVHGQKEMSDDFHR
jgi:hypothetical protein